MDGKESSVPFGSSEAYRFGKTAKYQDTTVQRNSQESGVRDTNHEAHYTTWGEDVNHIWRKEKSGSGLNGKMAWIGHFPGKSLTNTDCGAMMQRTK